MRHISLLNNYPDRPPPPSFSKILYPPLFYALGVPICWCPCSVIRSVPRSVFGQILLQAYKGRQEADRRQTGQVTDKQKSVVDLGLQEV